MRSRSLQRSLRADRHRRAGEPHPHRDHRSPVPGLGRLPRRATGLRPALAAGHHRRAGPGAGATGAAAGEDINITATGSSINLTSTEADAKGTSFDI